MSNKRSLQEAAKNNTGKLFSGSTDAIKETKKKSTAKKGFSFRGPEDDVKAWRTYAAITGKKVDDLGTQAMNEFIKKHKLSEAEQLVFDERMKS